MSNEEKQQHVINYVKALAAIEEETGSLHIDRLAQTGDSLSERDLGELRALAA